jgi:hypothetical protein
VIAVESPEYSRLMQDPRTANVKPFAYARVTGTYVASTFADWALSNV